MRKRNKISPSVHFVGTRIARATFIRVSAKAALNRSPQTLTSSGSTVQIGTARQIGLFENNVLTFN